MGMALACAALTAGCDPGDPAGPSERHAEPAPPRSVCVGPELCRVLVELGLAPGVVGADAASLALPELAHARDIGLSAERVRSLRPDLVLVLAAPPDPAAELAATLAAEGIDAQALAPEDANEVVATIHHIGRLTGREIRAAAVASALTREAAAVATLRDGATRLRVAWVLARDPLVVVGGSGLLHELLELAGAENAFHTPRSPRLTVTPEELAAREPEVVLGPPPLPEAAAGARRIALDPALAAVPLLDVAARVRALHAALYPGP